MNITWINLKPLVRELQLLRAGIERLAELKELELQYVHRLNTRTAPTAPSDLDETQVAYTDPLFEEAVRELERREGRTLTDDEVERVAAAVVAERDDG